MQRDVSRNKKTERGWGRGESEGMPIVLFNKSLFRYTQQQLAYDLLSEYHRQRKWNGCCLPVLPFLEVRDIFVC